MKKLFITLALLLPTQLLAEQDSVYSWGNWAQGVMPAAGGIPAAIPAPAHKPEIKIRPNEATGFGRSVVATVPAATPAVPATPATPTTPAVPATPAIQNTPPSLPVAPPPPPSAP